MDISKVIFTLFALQGKKVKNNPKRFLGLLLSLGVPSRPSLGSKPGPVQVPFRVQRGPVQIRHVLCFTVFQVGTNPARPGPILVPSIPSRIGPGRQPSHPRNLISVHFRVRLGPFRVCFGSWVGSGKGASVREKKITNLERCRMPNIENRQKTVRKGAMRPGQRAAQMGSQHPSPKQTSFRRFPLEPFFEINPGILCSGIGS